jgi:hypothetical protein
MSWTDALNFSFIPLHYTYALFTSSPQFTSLHLHFTSFTSFTSLHFTSLHFWMISPTPSLRVIYHFPNPFPEIVDLQETVPKASASSSRAGWSYLQRNIFHICHLLSAPNSPIAIDPAQIVSLCNLSPIAFQARSPVYTLSRLPN